MFVVLFSFATGLSQETQTIKDTKRLRGIESYDADTHEIGQARLRVKLVTRLDRKFLDTESQITLSFCTNTLCIENSDDRTYSFSDEQVNYASEGLTIADLSVDSGKIEKLTIRFENLEGSSVPYELIEVELPEGLELKGNYTSELFLALDATNSKKALTFLAFGDVHPEGDVSFVVVPDSPAKIVLEDGFTLDFPLNSIARTTVFSIKANDIAGLSSHYDIGPSVRLLQPVSIKLPYEIARLPEGMNLYSYSLQLGEDIMPIHPVVDPKYVLESLTELAAIKLITTSSYFQLAKGNAFTLENYIGNADYTSLKSTVTGVRSNSNAQVTDACKRRLSLEREFALALLKEHDSIRLTACEHLSPYVHIVMVNLEESNPVKNAATKKQFPELDFLTTPHKVQDYSLASLLEHVETNSKTNTSNVLAALNGFLWTGEQGYALPENGQGGDFKGTIFQDGQRLSQHIGAEAIIGFTKQGINGSTSKLFDKASNTTASLNPFDNLVIGSTTSIIKNGGCSRSADDARTSRWSAIGIGEGYVVMVSSVSGKTTDEYQLCSVFEALGAMNGAIRLDGGPSASIYWRATTLNPLTWPESSLYGSNRQVLYAIAAYENIQ